MKSILYTLILSAFFACTSDSNKVVSSSEISVSEDSASSAEKIKAEILEEGKPYWVQAKKEILQIKSYIKLAEEGTLSKKDVINEFNKTLGITMGRLYNFDKLKQRIEEAGDAYVELKYNKACAEIAQRKAAETSFELKK